MKIDHLVLGAYETNCYVLRKSENEHDCLIVDTGLEAEPLVDLLKEKKLKPVAVVLTHGHADHIAGLKVLRENFPEVKVYIHKLDAEMLTKPARNLSLLSGKFFKTTPADRLLEDGGMIEESGITLEVFHTPGHTQGGICLYCKEENIVFTGDTLFADSVGRTDFPGGSMDQLIDNIKQKLLPLADETVCLPGHGPSTTIGNEKKYNQYLR